MYLSLFFFNFFSSPKLATLGAAFRGVCLCPRTEAVLLCSTSRGTKRAEVAPYKAPVQTKNSLFSVQGEAVRFLL